MRDQTHPLETAPEPESQSETYLEGLSRVMDYLREHSKEPWALDFFALLRRLQSLSGQSTPLWGQALLPSYEPFRIGQEASLSFAPASLGRFDLQSCPPVVRQLFFSYIGPNGPLPIHLSDFIRERALNHSDPTWLAFLDMLLHRFALHFYRAWAQSNPAVGMDRPGQDRFRNQVGSLVGIGGDARQERDRVHDDARLFFAGHLSRRVHNRETIESVLSAYFSVPIRVEPWVGHWLKPPAQELTELHYTPNERSGQSNQRIGQGALLGKQVWDRQHKLTIVIGPMDLEHYLEFLPVGEKTAPLADWMAQLLGDELIWDAQLVVKKSEVPPTELGALKGNSPRLGWKCWLGNQSRERDARDVHIDRGSHAVGSRLALNHMPTRDQTHERSVP